MIINIDKKLPYDMAKFAIINNKCTYDNYSIFRICLDTRHAQINDSTLVFNKLTPNCNNFLIMVNEVLNIGCDVDEVTFKYVAYDTVLDNFICVDFEILLKENVFTYCNIISCHVLIDDMGLIAKDSISFISEYDVVKYLHENYSLCNQSFKAHDNQLCRYVCLNGSINIVNYLHKNVGLTKEDFQSNNNEICIRAFLYGNMNIIKYLHEEIGFTKEEILCNNDPCSYIWSCPDNSLEIIKYLHEEIKLTKEDVHSIGCMYACYNGDLELVKYLHQNVGLTKEYFQMYNNACVWSCINNKHDNVLTYLRDEVGIDVESVLDAVTHKCSNHILHNHDI